MFNPEFSHIKELIDRYYDGHVTPEQTSRLLDLLHAHPELPSDLSNELRVIEAIESTGRQIEISTNFNTRISSTIDKITTSQPKHKFRILNRLTIGIAACLLLCAGITASYMLTREPEPRYHVVTDAEEAKQYIAYADRLLSDSFQKAKQANQQAESSLEKAFNTISKHLSQQ